MSLIELKDVSYSYNEKKNSTDAAIDSVSVTIDNGDFIGLVGHTGSGKTTLLQTLNGLRKPTLGEVFYKGQNIWSDKLLRKQLRFEIGFVFQYPESQLFEETAAEDIAFGPKNMGLSDDEIALRVKEAASLLNISDSILRRNPFELSGGEKRRVAIAGVLAMRPSILVLDEPTVGLDPKGRTELLDFIKRYHKSKGGAVIMSSHNMDDISALANKVLVMKEGKAVAFDSPSNIFSNSELLEKSGLLMPSYSEIFSILKKEGLCARTDVFTLEEAKKECSRLFAIEEAEDA